RARHDRRTLLTKTYESGADLELAGAVRVRDPYPEGIPADADPRIHPQRVIVEPDAGLARRRRSGPGSDPMPVVVHGGLLPFARYQRAPDSTTPISHSDHGT